MEQPQTKKKKSFFSFRRTTTQAEEDIESGEITSEPIWLDDLRNATWYQILTFSWATTLIKEAKRREINAKELWWLRDKNKARSLRSRMELTWKKEMIKHGQDARLVTACLKCFGYDYLFSFFYQMGWLVAVLVTNTYLLVELLNILERFGNGEEPTKTLGSLEIPYRGFIYATCFCIGEFARSLLINRYWAIATQVGIDMRAAVISLLFHKTIKLRRSSDAMGKLLNMVSNDAERLREGSTYGLFVITTPITLIAIIGVGLWVIGSSILAGFVILIFSIPIQTRLGKLTGKYRRESVGITDERVSLMNEILKAAQLIKLYAWEESFMDKIELVRGKEIAKIKKSSYTKAANTAFTQVVPLLTSLITFIFHTIILENELTPAQAFATLAIFNVARFPLSVLPLAIRFSVEMFVGLNRMTHFLFLEELREEDTTGRKEKDANVAIEISNAEFIWDSSTSSSSSNKDDRKNNASFKLKDEKNLKDELNNEKNPNSESDEKECERTRLSIDHLHIKPGSLNAIIGKVGSGKSSFLAGALLGDMRRLSGGRSDIYGSVAYVSQNCWIFNGTVLENIILDKPYDETKFNQTVSACALLADLKSLPKAELTELGERGINVSGGQKARIALARAVYADSDIYLLDDVLSAVDAHVSLHIWQNCITKLLDGKTILLATHAVQYLPHTDRVLIFDKMKLIADGSFSDLQSSEWNDLIISSTSKVHNDKNEDDEENIDRGVVIEEKQNKEDFDENDGKLISEEERKVGAVTKETVKEFVSRAGGPGIMLFSFCLFWLGEGGKFGSESWLTAWTEDTFNREAWFYTVIYASLGVFITLILALRGVVFSRTALTASQALHNSAFGAVMKAKLEFFQTTPLGRIIARFSADIDKVDILLVDIAEVAITLLVRSFLSIVIISIVLPWFLIAVVPLILFYIRLLNYFRKVVRQMKRLDNLSRSPLISQVQSISQGLTSARAFKVLDDAMDKNLIYVDETSRAFSGFYFANRWIAIRIDLITTSIVTITSFLVVIFASKISPGLGGLALVSALQMGGIFQFATRQLAELESQFTCVERLRHFIENTPFEEDENTVITQEPNNWPNRGEIEFQNFSVRYREGLPLVLKDLNLKIPAGTKAALVGRTGSGKSSTLLSLFRLIEGAQGKILIDGVDIKQIALKNLRRKALSVVPQDATLFRGSIRYNLDPFQQHDDEHLWAALKQVHLGEYLLTLPNGLDYQLDEGGVNLSQGQRQLFCFARAVLRDTQILCIDEGTSSIDEKSDQQIQNTLREVAQNKTLIVIAHRLNTVRNMDLICVLDQGQLVESGHPDILLQNPNGHFYQMWESQSQK